MPEQARLDLYTNYILKYDSSESISSSRENMYADRILGITAKPFFGWGYGIKPKLQNSFTGVEKLNDTEKGNSYLAFIEEIGVWMGVTYLLIFFMIIFQCARHTDLASGAYSRRLSAISLGIILAGVVHANFESWLFYYGSFIANYFWLTLLNHRSLRNASA
jgi:O-antigen ligase|tara:strand:+ start:145 stop:630 length:486 start_codon:yes stop_codon:yes gene_type:complete